MASSEQVRRSQTASIAVTGQDKDSQTASIAVTGKDKDLQTASIAQDESSYASTTDTSRGSVADAATSGGSTVVPSGYRESSATVPSTMTG